MSRLVIVSNRVMLPTEKLSRAGGLAVAMREALSRLGGVWFGWSGETVETEVGPPTTLTQGKVTYVTSDLTQAEHEAFYVGYANSTLWPILHYRLGIIDFQTAQFDGYRHVNQRFAAILAPLLQPDDLVWVHDYHFLPLGAELRKLGVANRIGFFLHTPFPAPEVLSALPRFDTLEREMCSYDVIGFQTAPDVESFRRFVESEAHVHPDSDGIFTAFGRTAVARAFPIGIDTARFVKTAETAAQSSDTTRLKESLAGRALIIGVDRLDYSKGIPRRFDAYNQLLGRWPQHRQHVTLLQIAPISRAEVPEYKALRRELERAAGRINGKYAEFDWQPIRYLNKGFPRKTLAGFYRHARVGLVTPLRDGMNLVAKEFVAAQDPADPGVLVLSQFAGAARELDAALIVNPFDVDRVAEALHQALTMRLEERQERWEALMAIVRTNTITTWRDAFLTTLRTAPASMVREDGRGAAGE